MLAELQPKEDISISLQADISISMLQAAHTGWLTDGPSAG